VTGLLLALLAGFGTYLVYSAVALGWRGLGPAPAPDAARVRSRVGARCRDWLRQAGLEEVNTGEFLAVVALLFAAGAVAAWALFGGPLPALIAGGFSASFPLATYRSRRERRRSEARDAWPRLIEELRLLTGSLGRSVPQALFEVGRRGPADMRGAFAAAEREWLITTDFDRTVATLKSRLGDATADATCETLLIAHQVGGSDLDRRLAALAEDRIQDLQGRKDALAQQAGVRFARKFVLVVPLGMALAGMSIGAGRSAYQTPLGQLAVVIGLASIAVCWIWAGRLMRLPDEQRVFSGQEPAGSRPSEPMRARR
jgi:tight adherence protein B